MRNGRAEVQIIGESWDLIKSMEAANSTQNVIKR